MSLIYFDLETRSCCDLKQSGSFCYAEDPTTEILIGAECIDDGHIAIHTDYRKSAVYETMRDNLPNTLICHNSSFDITILLAKLNMTWGDLLGRNYTIHDTLICAYACGLPSRLNDLGQFLVGSKKLESGTRLINQYSKPIKGTDTFNELLGDDRKTFIDYAKQDVQLLIQIYKLLPNIFFNDTYYNNFILTQIINQNGLPFDVEALEHTLKLIQITTDALDRDMAFLTGGFVDSGRKVGKLKDYIHGSYPELQKYFPDLCAATVSNALTIKECEPVYRLLEIRQQVSLSSIKKLKRASFALCSDDTIKGGFVYHGAQTGRDAGRIIQPQNFPRGMVDDYFFETLSNPEMVELSYSQPLETIKSNLRGYICAKDNYELYCVDYANIETRLLFWLAKDPHLMDFERGQDLYVRFASMIFLKDSNDIKKDSFERRVGKEAILGLGYGMGHNKFAMLCQQKNLDVSLGFALGVVNMYRSEFKQVQRLWYRIEDKFRGLVKNQAGRYKIVTLKSGRKLFYDSVHLDENGHDMWYHKKGYKRNLYGALLTENYIQAMAADLLLHATKRLTEEGFDIVLRCHDEIVVHQPIAAERYDEFMSIMSEKPSWLIDFPLDIEGWRGKRYRK